jgi:hypothetical protein
MLFRHFSPVRAQNGRKVYNPRELLAESVGCFAVLAVDDMPRKCRT